MTSLNNSQRSIWVGDDGVVRFLDQTALPFARDEVVLASLGVAEAAIKTMKVRGAPLIGVTAAFGLALAARQDCSDHGLQKAHDRLAATRPTAVNLTWALERVMSKIKPLAPSERAEQAFAAALEIYEMEREISAAIGRYGLVVLKKLAGNKAPGEPLNILTHCNAGALATVELGTATAPIYMAAREGLALHVWVDETRPRNQGGLLTAYELSRAGIPHTVIVDNAGGHLMQKGLVDLCLVGTDRTTARGDVANKIGTYLKALAAHDNDVPFYVALPSTTIDWTIEDGVADIAIEERDQAEVTELTGPDRDRRLVTIRVINPTSTAANFAFDVTPAHLITGLITERGICEATAKGLRALFPDGGGNPRVATSDAPGLGSTV